MVIKINKIPKHKILNRVLIMFYFVLSLWKLQGKEPHLPVFQCKINAVKLICFSVYFIKQMNIAQKLSEE